MKYCPYCGKDLLLHDYKFCPECGKRLVHEQNEAPVPEATEYRTDETPDTAFAPDINREASENSGSNAFDRTDVFVDGEARKTFAEELHAVPRDAYRDFAPIPPVPDPAAPHDAYREFAPAVVVRDEAEDDGVIALPDEEIEPEPEVWLRPDGWTPEAAGEPELVGHTAQDIPPHVRQDVRGKRSPKVRIGVVFLVALLLIGAIAGAAMLKLRQNGAAQSAAERFAQSVYTGDAKQVLAVLETAGSGFSSSEDVATMCEAVKESVSQQQLQDHLLAMGDPMAPGYKEALSSIQMNEKKSNLFFQKYSVTVSAVPVLVKADIDGATIYVDGERRDTAATTDGLLLHLAPGRHELRAVYADYGKEYELGLAKINSLSSITPQVVSLAQNTASIEIELAGIETNLVVKVDGRTVRPQETGGWLTISPAFVGMEIELTCAEYGQTIDVVMAGKQSVSVDYIALMEQQNPGGKIPLPDMLTNRQLADRLGKRFYTCYRSYLDASNNKNEALIRDSGEEYKAALIRNIEEYNSNYIFEFKSMEVDYRSVARRVEDDVQFATVRVEVIYNYSKRGGPQNWLAGFNRQDVTLRFDEGLGDWIVYGSRVNDGLLLSEDTFTIT